MKRFFRITGCMLLALACIVAIAYVAIIVINRSDRPASAAAIRLEKIAEQLPQVRDADNGFVFVAGFSAAAGQDPMAVGAQRIAWTHQMAEKKDADIAGAFLGRDQRPGSEPTAAMKALGDTCKVPDAACRLALEGNAALIAGWLAADDLLVQRYHGLLSRPAWRETAAFDTRLPVPRFALPLDGQRLLFLQAWRAAGQGDARAVNVMLERDGVFWRTVLASSDTLIAKMIARAALVRNFEWGSLIMRRLPHGAAPAAVPGHWNREISAQERSLLRTSAGEYRYIAHAIKFVGGDLRAASLAESAEWSAENAVTALLMPTFQPQDYKNRYAALVAAVSDTFDVPYEAYPAAAVRSRSLVERTAAQAFDHPLYNWPGSALLAVGLPDFGKYAAGVADLEGVRRLALLTTQLRGAQVAAADVPQRLGEAALRDPYTGKPFSWDARQGSLVFFGLQDLPRGRHAVLY